MEQNKAPGLAATGAKHLHCNSRQRASDTQPEGASRHEKAYRTVRARLALAGYALNRSDSPTFGPCLMVSRWGQVRELRDLADAERFADQVGARNG